MCIRDSSLIAQYQAPIRANKTESTKSTSAYGKKSKNYTKNKIKVDNSNLNPSYNFSSYVVGSCNQFAHAACVKVAERLGATYNPLFIYGGVGLGKTHLANAIGNATKRRNGKTLLISSERFVSELITAIKTNRTSDFRKKFRTLDLLIVDDIQFIIGKERTQEEFFHTFNELYNRGSQVVVTSDKLPHELINMEERLRTRFASGLSVDLQVPAFETRVAIVNKKSEQLGLVIPEDVSRFIAERIDTNVRELEGALNRLKATCSIKECSPSVKIAEEVVNIVAPLSSAEITPGLIQRVVAGHMGVGLGDLLGKRRTQHIAGARQIAMFLCRKLTPCSYPELGALFGGRDHSTVIHAFKVVKQKSENDSEFARNLEFLEKEVRSPKNQ